MRQPLKKHYHNRLTGLNARVILALVLVNFRCLASTIVAGASRCLGTSTGRSMLIYRFALIVLGMLVVANARADSDDNIGESAERQPTAVVVSAINRPLVVPGSDGLMHLEYDLFITNVFVAPVTLISIEVKTPDGRKLLELSGDALAKVTEPLLHPGFPVTPPSQIPGFSPLTHPGAASGSVAVLIDVAVPHGDVPKRLTHRITYDLPPDAPSLALIGSREIEGPELVVDSRPPVVVAPPLRGNGWISLQGCCMPNGHRSLRYAVNGKRIIKAEMFAIDWVQLRDGFPFTGDGSRVEQYFGFGADVLAAADGTVVFVRDDMPEEIPNQLPVNVKKPIDFAGNQVVLQIGPDVWAVYAHLQTGSVKVRVGEQVTTGQVLGRLGNSGNTTAPHLHFVLTDHPNFVIARSVPFVLNQYTLAGFVTQEAFDDQELPFPISGSPQPQRHTHQLVLTVADFPPRHDRH